MDLERYQTLARQNSIARQTAEDQEWIVKQDQGTVDLDKAQIRTQQLNLLYCHIEAPADGRVGLRLVDPGNYVQAGLSTGLVVLTLLHPISVIFNVPEDSLPQIMALVHAGAVLPVTALDRANVAQLGTGQFASIDTEVDQTTGTVKLRANFDNPDESLFPSQFVNVQMLLDTLHDVVTIPISAVQRGAPGTYVYLLKDDDTVSVHPVTLGAQDGDLVAVQTGLEAGERVVTDGADRLRDGAKVVVPEAKAARPADGQPPNGRTRRRRGQPPAPGEPPSPGRPPAPGQAAAPAQ
jgi:multidrug efflux system membrane fusion protein